MIKLKIVRSQINDKILQPITIETNNRVATINGKHLPTKNVNKMLPLVTN